jgi:hypothetical protein
LFYFKAAKEERGEREEGMHDASMKFLIGLMIGNSLLGADARSLTAGKIRGQMDQQPTKNIER